MKAWEFSGILYAENEDDLDKQIDTIAEAISPSGGGFGAKLIENEEEYEPGLGLGSTVWVVAGMYDAYGDTWPATAGVWATEDDAKRAMAAADRTYTYEIFEVHIGQKVSND